MSNITVFLFLLESVPGFEITLKSTLESISGKYIDNVFTKCDPYIADLIWSNVNKNRDSIKQINYLPKTDHSEDLNNNYINSEILQNSLENNDIENELSDYGENNINYNKKNKNNHTKSEAFLNTAPFLVAIFETISNITAQTCGGTLLSPNWVVTAGSCLNLLPSFYNSLTKQNKYHKSYYTIIANGKNPIIDGTIHNITKIVLHPKHNLGFKKNLIETEFQVAFMRIEPAVKTYVLPIFESKIKLGISVKVYGWTLQKNSTREYMSITSISAKIIPFNKCKANYDFVNKNYMICLSAENESSVKINQMSSGGPVLVYSEGKVKILAVAQIDTSSRIIAYTLTKYDWINDIIKT